MRLCEAQVRRKVVVVGTGSFAQVVRFYLEHDSEHEVVAFSASRELIDGDEFDGLPVVAFEDVEHAYPPGAYAMYVAVGYRKVNRVRARMYDEAKAKGYELITYISSHCTHWPGLEIGDNCFIFEDNTIQPFVAIGNDVVLWSGNHIGHHSTIGDHCFIASHVVISGHVHVGPYTFMGVNATTRDDITIGSGCVIGAGALIMRSTGDDEVYPGKGTKPLDKSAQEIDF
jgi:sugar O-acyltransferase (sialic acid O-acetyltransferase NeuD family)